MTTRWRRLRRLPRARGGAKATTSPSRGSRARPATSRSSRRPDVTIADLIGDVDPIKAARAGRELGDELTMHYGLLPRANRGIFAVNELPDLASKVQVGLFNILQEGDVQIKGYPVRLRLDVLLVFSANPEDYTARGKIITPLKDRIGSEIRTHYPANPAGSAGDHRAGGLDRTGGDARAGAPPVTIPVFVREIVEEIAFQARADQKVDRRSGVSQRLPITDARERRVERRAPGARCTANRAVVPRVSDIYASLPSLTGKIELEYEGELKGAEHVARELVRQAVATVFDGHARRHRAHDRIIDWFERRRRTRSRRTPRRPARCSRPSETIHGLARGHRGPGRRRRSAGSPAAARGARRLRARRVCAPCGRSARTDEGRSSARRHPRGPSRRRQTLEALTRRRRRAAAQGQEEVLQLTDRP